MVSSYTSHRDVVSADATENNCPDNILYTLIRQSHAIHYVVRKLIPFVQNKHSDVVKVVSDRIYVGPLEIARLLRQELQFQSHLPIADLAA